MKFLGTRSLALAVFGLNTLLGSSLALDITAGNIFDTPPTGTDGSCSGYDVDTMATEAYTLAENAVKALDTLLASNVFNNDDNQKLVETAAAIWGIRYKIPLIYFNRKIVITEGLDTLQQAKDYYVMAQNKLSSGSVDGARLTCGDSDWEFVTTLGNLGRNPPDALISSVMGLDANDYPGFYLSKYFTPIDQNGARDLHNLVMVPDQGVTNADGSVGGPLCSSKAVAITWSKHKMLMMCTAVFSRDSLDSRIAAQAGLSSGTSLDTQQTAGAEFLHEMMHFIDQGITDQKVADGSSLVPAYYWDACVVLANAPQYQGRAVKNADNYRTFALAVTLSDIDWSFEGNKP